MWAVHPFDGRRKKHWLSSLAAGRGTARLIASHLPFPPPTSSSQPPFAAVVMKACNITSLALMLAMTHNSVIPTPIQLRAAHLDATMSTSIQRVGGSTATRVARSTARCSLFQLLGSRSSRQSRHKHVSCFCFVVGKLNDRFFQHGEGTAECSALYP